VATDTNTKATLHQHAVRELKELVFISVYLYITLGAVILMKAAVLHTEGIALVLSVLAPVSPASFRHRRRHSNCYQDSEDNRGLPHIPPAPHCGGNMLAHCGSAP
jgi:hypothetical protein